MFRTLVHYGFHFLIPLGIALILFPKQWKKVYLIFLGAMLIDLDHLIANPIFDPNRCSIGFHFLHSLPAIILYLLILIPKKTRIIGMALLWHILTDSIDCLMI
ncbi:hypothetical protein D1815_09490 [Aquimarina sp. AD1]|uniref:DUF6122 family protein n=1 Tax=Aquimarina sp. (strain AD1) TaxID=1714848 RepID=UPI000E49F402|nr:DUF6122 family protein [Aquimarina sp. AD1]AXT55974.1 hypothetical protein D1815_09490 [Aquimarina sp. AD1]RKN23199.1 hypothetical protein D7035_11685 [Aquimarina sp. AD1]